VVPQRDTLDEELTVRENLVVVRALLRHPAASGGAKADELLEFAQLTERATARSSRCRAA
jgi:lipooligosaccharide transport system ATP-binding protein